jgi:hypothetical protein
MSMATLLGIDYRTLLDMPMIACGHLVAQKLVARGVKGIDRPRDYKAELSAIRKYLDGDAKPTF